MLHLNIRPTFEHARRPRCFLHGVGPQRVWYCLLTQLAESSESEPPRCGAEGVCGLNRSSLAAAARARSAIQPLAIGGPFGVPPEVRRLGGPLSSGGVCIPSPLLALTNVSLLELSIKELAVTYKSCLQDTFADTEPNVAEENLQARIRGNLLMALSNKFGWLVLTTGNKSEISVGYATLYGDMAGGFSVLKDVFKTWVYQLACWRNREGLIIPQRIIDRPPTAELRKQQLDSDSLPPYDVLDGILERYVERDENPSQIEDQGFDRATVHHVIELVDRSEYKRRQAPPGIRISTRAFGKDRRLPITNLYRP